MDFINRYLYNSTCTHFIRTQPAPPVCQVYSYHSHKADLLCPPSRGTTLVFEFLHSIQTVLIDLHLGQAAQKLLRTGKKKKIQTIKKSIERQRKCV